MKECNFWKNGSTGSYIFLSFLLLFAGCYGVAEEEDKGIALPVITLKSDSAVTFFSYLGAIEGKVNVEIRPQVSGILDSIYVDEGDFVRANQPLFKINELQYLEQLKNAQANVKVEKARLLNAQIELDRLQPLVENTVISDIQLRTAQSNYEIAKASLERSMALEATSRINLDFTLIKAPVSGYIGRIPKRIGNLVTRNDSQPMTLLSDIHEIYVYFAMSEADYLFYKKMSKDSSARRLNPHVKLILADGTLYEHPGIIDADAGQIDRSTGSITLRAKFSNPDKLLRSGNTGKIILEQIHPNVILLPQTATTVIQDKTFVYVLNKGNLVERREITIEGKTGKNYIIRQKDVVPGERVVSAGFDRLTSGIRVNPIGEEHVEAKSSVRTVGY